MPKCVLIDGKSILIEGRTVRIARLEQEWYEDVGDPNTFAAALRESDERPDVFTFWQRLPDAVPKYSFRMEHDSIAALPIQSYSFWWEKQIDAKTRNMVRKAEKKGVLIKKTQFDDGFVRGMASIFNETPIRQGKAFWHYGKDFETLKREFSRFLSREEIFGAYVGDELVGFIMLAFADRYALLRQIIAKIAHREKAPTNALIAAAVGRCAEKEIKYLVYAKWEDGTLGDFKRHNGFEKFDMPRYFVPLSAKGSLFVRLRLYRGVAGFMPPGTLRMLKRVRRSVRDTWHECSSKATT